MIHIVDSCSYRVDCYTVRLLLSGSSRRDEPVGQCLQGDSEQLEVKVMVQGRTCALGSGLSNMAVILQWQGTLVGVRDVCHPHTPRQRMFWLGISRMSFQVSRVCRHRGCTLPSLDDIVLAVEILIAVRVHFRLRFPSDKVPDSSYLLRESFSRVILHLLFPMDMTSGLG